MHKEINVNVQTKIEVKMSELSCGTRFIGRNETLDLSLYLKAKGMGGAPLIKSTRAGVQVALHECRRLVDSLLAASEKLSLRKCIRGRYA